MATPTKRPKLVQKGDELANKAMVAAATEAPAEPLKRSNSDYVQKLHESDEHWDLRRRFMEAYMDTFSEEKTACLAQVFVNVEFMGCKYPAETMRLVDELSRDLVKEFRAERANRLKRTFVTASNAAEQRAKGRRKQ